MIITDLYIHTIIVYPKIISISPDKVAIVHDTRWLQCRGYGDPKPSVTWYYSNAIFDTTSKTIDIYTVRNGIALRNVSLHDAGVYTCKVTNALNTITRDVTVTIQGMVMYAYMYRCYFLSI